MPVLPRCDAPGCGRRLPADPADAPRPSGTVSVHIDTAAAWAAYDRTRLLAYVLRRYCNPNCMWRGERIWAGERRRGWRRRRA